MTNHRLLVTGGAGFIGSEVVKLLVSKDYDVSLVLRESTNTWRIQSILSSVNRVKANYDEIEAEVSSKPYTGILHLATLYKKQDENLSSVSEMIDTNVTLPSMLISYAKKYKIPYFINTGTCFEYEESSDAISENSKKAAFNLYASTKMAFEEILTYFVQKKDVHALTLKLFYPYGELDNNKILNKLCSLPFSDEELVLNSISQKISYTYVHDIAVAYLKALTFLEEQKEHSYEVFNIGTPAAVSLQDAIEHIEQFSQKKLPVTVKQSFQDIKQMICNSDKANRLLQWQARTSFNDGLQRLFEYEKKKKEEHD